MSEQFAFLISTFHLETFLSKRYKERNEIANKTSMWKILGEISVFFCLSLHEKHNIFISRHPNNISVNNHRSIINRKKILISRYLLLVAGKIRASRSILVDALIERTKCTHVSHKTLIVNKFWYTIILPLVECNVVSKIFNGLPFASIAIWSSQLVRRLIGWSWIFASNSCNDLTRLR